MYYYYKHDNEPFQTVFKLFENDTEPTIHLLETVPPQQANRRVQHYIDSRPCINIHRRYTSPEQKKQQQRETHLAYAATHVTIVTCECGIQLRSDSLNVHKKRKAHMNRLNGTTPHSQHNCPCGGTYQQRKKTAHEKTQKHQTWLTTN